MRDALEKLIELQNVDSKLNEIEELRGSLPHEVEQLKKDLGGTQESLEESGSRIKEIDLQIRDIEGNVAQANQKLKKYKEQLYAVNTNKEYDALTHELEAIQNAIRESENQILDLMGEKEENEELNKNSKALLDEIEQDLESRSKELDLKISETKSSETKFLKKRKEIAPSISKALISKYEKIRNARNGRAVVPVIRGACGGCFHSLPPQLVVEVKKMERIINCEACGRVLIPREAVVEN